MASIIERIRPRRATAPAAEPDIQRLIEATIEIQEALEEYDRARVYRNIELDLPVDKPIGIVFASDLHLGGRGVDHRAIYEFLEVFASSPWLYCYLGGDVVDNFVITKLAHVGRDTQAIPPFAQWEIARDVIERLLATGGLLCVGSGNHDAWTAKVAGLSGHLAILRDMPVIYTDEGGYLDLRVGEQRYTIFRKHRPAMSSRYNPGHSARQALRFGERLADIVVVEHQHTPNIEIGRMFGEERVFVRTGSFKVHDAHAREFGFTDGGIGTPAIVLDPGERRMIPFSRVEDAAAFLELKNGSGASIN